MKHFTTQRIGLLFLLFAFAQQASSQVKIGQNPTEINKGSILELESANKGLLFPRVSLTNTTTWSLAASSVPTAGMMVYNINTTAAGFTGTTAYPAIAGNGTGIYYWDGNGWVATKGTMGADGKSVTGAAGAPGATTPGNQGDIYINTTTGDTYIKQGDVWVLNGNIKGDKGDKGDAGVVGVQGLPGTTGTPGTPGSGTPGAPGAGVTIVTNDSGTWVYNPTTNTWTNINGPKGDKGDAGVVGVEGMPGTSGTPGTPGSGTPGAPGSGVTVVTNDSGTWVYNPTTNTWTNINGPKGDKGDPGVVGVEGMPGTSGTPGAPGSGTPGAPGSGVTVVTNDSGTWVYNPTTNTWTNINGPKGDKGDKGDPGVVGVEGMPGTSGTPSTPGSGTPGAPGSGVTVVTNDSGTWVYNPTTNTWTNINGPKGDKGDPGVVGVEGMPGTSGTPGTPGSGTPGAPGTGVTIVTNDSGTWVYNPTTNTWTNINGPKGDKGDPGVVGVEGMPGTSGTPGTPGSGTPGAPGSGVTVVTNDSGTWVYNPTTNTWTNINGPKGDKGDPGVVGVEGMPGTSGTPGTPGSGTPGAPGTGVTIVTNDSGTWVYNPTTNTWTNINGQKGDPGTFTATAANGVFLNGTVMELGTNPLIKPTVLATSTANTLAITGLQPGITTGLTPDNIVVIDPSSGVLKSVPFNSGLNIYNSNGTITAGEFREVIIPEGSNLEFKAAVLAGFGVTTGSGLINLKTTEQGGYINIGTEANIQGKINLSTVGRFSDITLSTAGDDVANVLLQPLASHTNVGIGTPDPTEKLDVGIGNVRVRDINVAYTPAVTDKMVVADADGVLRTIPINTGSAIETKTAAYTLLATDETILVNATSGLVTITLPAASATNKGKKYTVKKVDSSSNGAQVISSGGTIDGNAASTGVTGTLPWQGWVFQSDGTNWYIISRI